MEDHEYGRNLVLNGSWNYTIVDAVEKSKASGLWIIYARGFVGDNIDFLAKLPKLRSLLTIAYNIEDLSPINHLHELRYLSPVPWLGSAYLVFGAML